MASVKLFIEMSNCKKPPSVEFKPDGLPFKLTVKHIKGMVQVETNASMKTKSLIGPDGQLHADSVAWEDTGWKSGDVLRIVDGSPPAEASGSSNSSGARKESLPSGRKSALLSGGSLMLSADCATSKVERAGSKCTVGGVQNYSESSASAAHEIEKVLASIASASPHGFIVDPSSVSSPDNLISLSNGDDIAKLTVSLRGNAGKVSQPVDNKDKSKLDRANEDRANEAELRALHILREQQGEIRSRSEACNMKLARLKELLQESSAKDTMVEHLMECELSVPRLPVLEAWNQRDLTTYLQKIALLQTQLESWSSEVDVIVGEGLSADVLREQLPQCAQFISIFSTFVITSTREAAEAAMDVLGQTALTVWEQWRTLPGTDDLGQIKDIEEAAVGHIAPGWFNAPDDIKIYLDSPHFDSNPGRCTMSQIQKWLDAVPHSSHRRISDYEYFAHPENLYWKKMTIRQRVAMVHLLDKAAKEDDAFHQALESAVSCVPDGQYKRGPVKRIERTSAKAVTDHNGDVFQIKDFHRALVVCPTPQVSVEAFHAFEQEGRHIEIVKCKNGFLRDYWGHNLKLVMISIKVAGVLGEVQICPSEMFQVRDMMHHYYDFARASSVDDFR